MRSWDNRSFAHHFWIPHSAIGRKMVPWQVLRRATVESARPQFSNSMLQPRSNGKDFRSSALVLEQLWEGSDRTRI